MDLYNKILNNKEYLETVKKIENIKFITDGKWDWEHGLGHYKRTAEYAKDILKQLGANKRTIDLALASSLLHDIGLSKGDKVDHALESSKLFTKFIKDTDINDNEIIILKDAIKDHSNGNDIKSLVGLALVLADKLDVTYHRTINSSIQDETNKEIQKIKKVDIKITDKYLTVYYKTDDNFNVNVFKEWKKAITIPNKIAHYLNKTYILNINDKEINFNDII